MFTYNWIQNAADALIEAKEHLTDLDQAIGDGDHGINMARGATVIKALPAEDFGSDTDFDCAGYLKKVGMSLVSSVGGASGPLYGTFFLRMGSALIPAEQGAHLSLASFTQGVHAGLEGLKARGKAEYGEKTMVDVWEPVAQSLQESLDGGHDFSKAIHTALDVARKEAQATIDRVATKGRASYLGENSAGTMDPGAASSLIWLEAAAKAL